MKLLYSKDFYDALCYYKKYSAKFGTEYSWICIVWWFTEMMKKRWIFMNLSLQLQSKGCCDNGFLNDHTIHIPEYSVPNLAKYWWVTEKMKYRIIYQ